MQDPIGYRWLSDKFKLNYNHFHRSVLSSKLSSVHSGGQTISSYTAQYKPNTVIDHLVFGLKNEGLYLDLLQKVLPQVKSELLGFIEQKPSSQYARKLGFLYEFLTGQTLQVQISGNYVDLASADLYVLADGVKDKRWRINNNLPGNRYFCPLVRRTDEINKYLAIDYRKKVQQSLQAPPEILARALNYFYFKETKSSNDIEREKPTADRERLFVELLKQAGKSSVDSRFSQEGLTQCQNTVVDPRYHDECFRDIQNYVGEASIYGRAPFVHLVGMPPELIDETMQGFTDFNKAQIHPVVKAACSSFGFVFIHPFNDGNGRVHRFIFNDILARESIIDDGVILPVSAVMHKDMKAYDKALECFSKPLMLSVNYQIDEMGYLTVDNPQSIAGQYRFPDLTEQTYYMFQVLDQTIDVELIEEIRLIEGFDRFRSDAKYIVDMPNKKTELMIKLLFQGGGVLSNTKKGLFSELSSDDISRLELAYKEAFEVSSSEDTHLGP